MGLEALLDALPTLASDQRRLRAQLLWEELNHLEERRGKGVYTGEYTWTHYGCYRTVFDAAFVRLLNSSAWVAAADGELQRPDLVVFGTLSWKTNPFLESKICFKEFRFDAAHTLDSGPQGDPRYRRMHGHSYQVEVWIYGDTSEKGWIMDMGEFEKRITAVAQQLDHYYLNDLEDLGTPTMENISAFVWRALTDLNGLSKVVVRRDSAREGCVYRGPSPRKSMKSAADFISEVQKTMMEAPDFDFGDKVTVYRICLAVQSPWAAETPSNHA